MPRKRGIPRSQASDEDDLFICRSRLSEHTLREGSDDDVQPETYSKRFRPGVDEEEPEFQSTLLELVATTAKQYLSSRSPAALTNPEEPSLTLRTWRLSSRISPLRGTATLFLLALTGKSFTRPAAITSAFTPILVIRNIP